MNYKRLIGRVSFACLAILLTEGLNPVAANAERVRSLYAQESDWVNLTVNPGVYILQVAAIANLGDVDVDLYDTNGRRFARGTRVGNETIRFTVPQGAEGVFQVRYSMPFCLNPAGPCGVTMNLYPQ